MKKVEFLRELENTLNGYLSQHEINKVLSKYSDIFDSALADGKTNDETSEEIGSPAKISRTILESSSLANGIKKDNSQKISIEKTSFKQDVSRKNNKHKEYKLASMPRRLLAYIVDMIFVWLILAIPCMIMSSYYFESESTLPSQPEKRYEQEIVPSHPEKRHEQKNPTQTQEEIYQLLDSDYNIIEPIETHSETNYKIIYNQDDIKILLIIFSIMANFLTALQLWVSNGYTIGKYIFRIRVVRLNNKKLTFADVFMREIMAKTFANYITYSILNIVSFIWACSTHEHKTIHDLAVGTKVINT